METIKITKKDLDDNNKYKKGFIGKWDEKADVSVEIDSGLGTVVFEKGIYVNASIKALAGSGISAGSGILSGLGSIKAKLAIKIDARCRIIAGCFSFGGAQEVEAQEIEGEIAYGIKKLLPKSESEEISLKGKEVEVKLDGKVYKVIIQ